MQSAIKLLMGAALVSSVAAVFDAEAGVQERVVESVENEYIVVLEKTATTEAHEALAAKLGGKILKIGDSYKAVHATLEGAVLESTKAHEAVAYVEPNYIARALDIVDDDTCQQEHVDSWGLSRLNSEEIVLNSKFQFKSAYGEGVDVFIVDTGIYLDHDDFTGRVFLGKNTVPGSSDDDKNGHGTHVAGTAAGTTHGIARKATLYAVKVLGDDGSGSYAGVIEGVQYTAEKKQQSGNPSVANMSLGGPSSRAMDEAVEAAVAEGVVFAIAAGNGNGDACKNSPAAAETGITVASSDIGNSGSQQTDMRSYFSDYGSCVDIIAPGSDITSAWIGSPDAENTISGTSMASPHVAGVAAVYLGYNPSATPAEVGQALFDETAADLVNLDCRSGSVCDETPNHLLQRLCD